VVGWSVGEGVRLEAEGAADAARAAVTCGEDVNVGVADHDGSCGVDGDVGDGSGFGHKGLEAVRVGLFCVEAVAAVVLEEEAREVEVSADVARGADRFVGEDGHENFGVVGADGSQCFEDAWVEVGIVEFVDAVVVEKECDRLGYVLLVSGVAFGVADGAADQHGDTIADVAGDDSFGKRGLAKVREGGVDGVAEVDARVDESAVEIEDDEAGCDGESGHSLNANRPNCCMLQGQTNQGGVL
jgi:hypothetical protein